MLIHFAVVHLGATSTGLSKKHLCFGVVWCFMMFVRKAPGLLAMTWIVLPPSQDGTGHIQLPWERPRIRPRAGLFFFLSTGSAPFHVLVFSSMIFSRLSLIELNFDL